VANSTSGFRNVTGLNRAGLRRDHATFDIDVLGHAGIGRRIGWRIVLGEIDDFVTLVGDRHARDDGVIVAAHQIRDDRIPVVLDPFAGQLGPRAQLVAQLALEAVDLARVIDEVPRRIGTLGAQTDRLVLGHRHATGQGCGKCGKN